MYTRDLWLVLWGSEIYDLCAMCNLCLQGTYKRQDKRSPTIRSPWRSLLNNNTGHTQP